MSALKDKIIGGFRVLAEIQAGSGSQGTVYKAVCDEDKHGLVPVGTVVALKVMPVQDEGQAQWRKLEKRTRELANLNHPSVVKYHGCFSEQGTFNDVHVVVQEFLDGETLKERLARNPSGLDVDEAIRIARLAIEGLVYTTGAGIVHRDIKPGNIFLCRDGGVKLIDFEIAQQAGGTTTSTAGNIRGSFDYMAPDFTDADFHGDVKSDVFSMGVVLHEMLCGKTPYQRLSGADNRQANFAFLARWSHPSSRGSGSPIHVSSRIRRLLAHTDDVFAKSLAPRREDRYPDFQSLLSDLGKIRFRNLRNGDTTYQMLQFIGKGGFGEVFKARLKQTGQLVAVKHLLKDEYAERFRREAKIMKKLVSPCFVRFVDFFSQDIAGGSESFLVMEFLDGMPGSSLRDAIKRAGGAPLDVKSAFVAFERYARGLHAMHEAGIFHRDIKPSNLYFPPDAPQRAAIMDLGIARDVNGTATHGQVPGTLDYMPPEVVLSDNRGDAGMDIYALGLCFYEALAGKTAYPRLPTGTAGYAAFFERAKNGVRPTFDALDSERDKDVLSLIREMTNVDPQRRLNDAGAVAEWILHIAQERFGDSIAAGHDDLDDPATSCPTVTIAPTVAVNPETQGTVATQLGDKDFVAEMEREKRQIAQRRHGRRLHAVGSALKAAAAVVLLAAAGVGLYYSWPLLKDRLAKNIESIGNTPHAGGKSVVATNEVPAAIGSNEAVRMEVTKQCFVLMREEPVEDRRRRLDEARDLMEENKINGVFSDIQAEKLEEAINERRRWIVGKVANKTATLLSVAGQAVDPGRSEIVKFEEKLPDPWICSADGYDDVGLPHEFDGRTIDITETDLVPRAVVMKLPNMDKDVSCVFDGKVVAKQLSLRPGSYSCRYTRPGYADQSVSFSVEFNKDGELPRPGKWNADAVKVSCPELDDDVKCRVDGVDAAAGDVMLAPGEHVCEYMRADYEPQRIPFTVEVLKARSLPPCGAWKDGPALMALKEAEKAVEANDWHGAEDSLKRATVVARHNVDLKTSLHEAVERGKPVKMTLPQLEKNVICFFNGSEVSGSLSLRPGKYFCRYSRAGCEDQEIGFEVYLGRDGVLPPPGAWSVKPVSVRFRFPGAGVACKVDGRSVNGDVQLAPGRHVCRYERDDYLPQEIEFNVDVGVGRDLPPCGADWQEGDGLKALNDAEEYAKKGDWLHAEGKLGAAVVKSPVNVERRNRLVASSRKQVDVQKKLRQAEAYFMSEEYYEYVKAFHEAVREGHLLSVDEKARIGDLCNRQIDSLTKQIDYYEGEIQKGRLGFVRDIDSMKGKRKNLIDWRIELTGE